MPRCVASVAKAALLLSLMSPCRGQHSASGAGAESCEADDPVEGSMLLSKKIFRGEAAADLVESPVREEAVPSFEQQAAGANLGFQSQWLVISDKNMGRSVQKHQLGKVGDSDTETWGGAVVFVIDLGEVYVITKTSIIWRVCTCSQAGSVVLKSSKDARTWETYHSPTLHAWGDKKNGNYDVETTGRFIMVETTNKAPTRYVSFWEFGLMGYLDPHRPNLYGWYPSYKAGEDGLAGTEILHLTPYKGKLFGGTGYWMAPGAFRPAEVVRLDCPFCTWVVETAIGRWAGRTEILKAVRWTTNANGQAIAGGPVDKLLAGYYMDWGGIGKCFYLARDDNHKNWHSAAYWEKRPFKRNYFSARALELYQDPVTGVDRLFFSTGMDGIISGVYNPHSHMTATFPGHTESGPVGTRPLGITKHDGKLYFSASSKIYRRQNGPNPSWSVVFDMAENEAAGTVDEAVGGIRGLTSISNPASPTGNSLMFSWAPNERSAGCMVRLDKHGDGFVHETEQCVKNLASNYLGTNSRGLPAMVTFVIADYNGVLEINKPGGGLAHIVGFEILLYSYSASEFPINVHQQAMLSSGKKIAFYSGAGYIVRHSATDYEVRTPLRPRYDPLDLDPFLTAVRCYSTSPFPDDTAIYMGGHDCNHYKSINTAWVLRGEASAVYEQPVPCQVELGCGHVPGTPFQTSGCDLCRGRTFNGAEVAFFRDHEPFSCQMTLDWLNNEASSHCSSMQNSEFARKCCEGCDFCLGTSTSFAPDATAGNSGSGAYTCQVALDYMMNGGATCLQATSWWKGACCQ